jgi:hypothetical protein
MTDWVPFYNFLPRVPVTSLILNEPAGVIKAVTFGHGVWQSPVYSACPSSLTLSGSNSGYKVYETGTLLTSSADVFGGDNTEVYYKSGNTINLIPGFIARAGNSVFKAYIGPCGNGIPSPDQVGTGEGREGTLQNREWTTNYPWGAIVNTPIPGSGANTLSIKVPERGDYKIMAADEDGNLLEGFEISKSLDAGMHEIQLPAKPKAAFYLKLMKGETLCDTKEW